MGEESGPRARTLDELPVFDEWDDPDFGRDFEWVADDLFQRPHQGVLRGSDDSAVLYRNADVRAVGAAPVATHQTVESMCGPLRDLAGEGADGVFRLVGELTFSKRQPKHLVNKHLSARRLTTQSVARWSAEADRAVESQLARVADGSEIDFIRDVAQPVVVDFWHRALGITAEEGWELMEATADFLLISRLAPNADEIARASRGAERFREIVPSALKRELRAGRNEVLAELQDDYSTSGESFDPSDPCVAFGRALLDGFHTLALGMALATYGLLANEASCARVKSDPRLVGSALMESLRLHGPVVFTQREAGEEFEHDGVVIPAGTTLTMLWFFANRDPTVFEDANAYKLDRDNRVRQVPFGAGLYVCTGRNLARMVCESALRAVTSPLVEVAPAADAVWTPASSLHELASMPVTVRRSR